MPRRRRIWKPGHGQHVISRFVDRRFKLDSEVDRDAYLRFAGKAHARWDWRWLSYALMSSHVHDGFVAGCQAPDRYYQSVHVRYAQYYERHFDSLGPIFAGRPKNYFILPENLPRMVAYHHRNPDLAGIVDRPSESTWTSHRAYLRLTPPPKFLDIEWALSVLGFDDTPGGRRSFDEFVSDFDFSDLQALPPDGLEPLDQPVVSLSNRPLRLDESAAAQLLGAVAKVCDLEVKALCSARYRQASHGRRVLAYVAVHDLAVAMSDAAKMCGQRRTTLANLLTRASDAELRQVRSDARRVNALLSGLAMPKQK